MNVASWNQHKPSILAANPSELRGRELRSLSLLRQAFLVVLVSLGAGCAASSTGEAGVRPPNPEWCSRIVANSTVRIQPELGISSVVLCGPDVAVGTPCVSKIGLMGVCRDFVAESNGHFAEFARQNRVPTYCWPFNYDPCGGFAARETRGDCAPGVTCIQNPNGDAGQPQYMCPPVACN